MNAKLAARLVMTILFMLPLCANAQAWLPDRETREGPGIRVGDALIFHPGVVAEGGWDTNPIRESESPEGAGRLRLGAYLDLATRNRERRAEDEEVSLATPPKLSFRFGLAGFYDFFFSKVPAIKNQRDFGIDTHLNFILFPAGPYSLMLNAAYNRKIEPYESGAEMHARDSLRPGIGVQIRPGGGTLMLSLKYDASVVLFEDPLVAAARDKVTHNAKAEISWKVLPKTAAVSIVRFSPTHYWRNGTYNNDSMPIRALCGLRGLLTNRFGISLFVGYGASFYSQGDDFEGVIADGELIFFVTPTVNVRVGGQRDFVDSFYANYYVKSGGYAKYSHMFARVFQLSFKAEAFYRQYSTFSGAYMGFNQLDDHRTETWLAMTLSLEYRATDWMSVLGSAVYKGNISDFSYSTGTSVAFQEFEGLLGLRFHY